METVRLISNNYIKLSIFLKGVIISLIFTLLVGYLTILDFEYYDFYEALIILAANYIAMVIPISFTLRKYLKHKDIFYPAIIFSCAFIGFQLFFNMFVINSPVMLEAWGKYPGPRLVELIVHTYLVVFIAWCSFEFGYLILGVIEPNSKIKMPEINVKSPMFILIGLSFLVIGIIGNIGLIGGIKNYLTKIIYFYQRWEIYNLLSLHGATKWRIAIYFLPVGLAILGHGFSLKYNLKRKTYMLVIAVFSLANIFLSNATGGRGMAALTFLYFIFLYNGTFHRIRIIPMVILMLVFTIVAIILGGMRAAASYGVHFSLTSASDYGLLMSFIPLYLCQFSDTMVLVRAVEVKGILYGKTAFAGLTGLLGGPTPLRTENIFWNTLGFFNTNNPTFGPIGDLYINFGWVGLAIGMIFIGMVIRLFSQAYERALLQRTLYSGLIVMYTCYTSYFLIRANLSYMPSYFILYSAPFWIAMLLLRKRIH